MRLVYLSPVPWASFAQRPHKFVEWFHKRSGEEVLWIDPYPTRFPALSDFKRLDSPALQAVYEHPSWLQVVKPTAVPLEPLPGSGWLNALMWRQVFTHLDTFVNRRAALVVIGKPSVLALVTLKKFRWGRSIYDAMDDFPAFYEGLSRVAIRRREEQLARRVSVIWASSTVLRRRWNGLRPDVQLVHNGLDLSALPTSKTPPRSSEQKVFGYVGTIATWFDWDWVCVLAEARPKDEIRLIGPVFEPSIQKLPQNISLLPACNHAEALRAMMDFDVGLIPFKRNELTASVDPIKYYEYRALSLPVVSTDFGEMRCRSGVSGVFISQSDSDAASLAEAALRFERDSGRARAFALQNAWEARFDAAKLLP
jgi:hypothetical protein